MKYWWQKYQREGNVNATPRNVQRRALTADEENEIIQKIQDDPFLTAIYFAREYGVSDNTIHSLFKRNGLKCRSAATQTLLKEEHKINRMAFCQTMIEWEQEKLNSIIFSDEKTFCSDVKWRSKVYRPFGTRYDPDYVKPERHSGRISACYWGSIGIDGPATNLIKINGKLTAQKYMGVIRNNVTPIMQNNERIFMQDNHPVHTAGVVMAYLGRQTYQTMAWPPMSPDLNPIENVWSFLIRDWPMMPNRTDAALDEIVQRRWNNLRNNPGISTDI